MKEYLTIKEAAFGEYVEKRSKFISGIYPVLSETEASDILSKVKSDNFGANHNVYAYILSDGTARFSDDGEPHGTAGKPVLEVLEGSKLQNVLIVVTRYFGGVLLGTGGLVRAYTAAAQNALSNSSVVKMCECVVYSALLDYSKVDKLTAVIDKFEGSITDTVYEEKVKIVFNIQKIKTPDFVKSIKESFSGEMIAKEEKIGIFPVKI
ncbi:MAG: YigZ family protein [Clostridia bacterium]|nr:YigZ family protein [Clostridia bacterium]